MSARLRMVYGIVLDPSLEIVDFQHVISFDAQTRVLGVELDRKPTNEFIEVVPVDLDESDLSERYLRQVDKVVAEVIEVEGDLVTSAQRHSWERKLRRQNPKILVGVSE